jgi:hypothetical protein
MPDEVFIYLDFMSWNPLLMNRQGEAWTIVRMCPPGSVQFFFSMNGVVDTRALEQKNDANVPRQESPYKRRAFKKAEEYQLTVRSCADLQDMTVEMNIPKVEVMTIERFDLLNSETIDLAIDCLPRSLAPPIPELAIPPAKAVTRTQLPETNQPVSISARPHAWDFTTSIFREYQPDSYVLAP